ncbi:MAG: purine-nucleoside/S-methyl-5-thioadenosine phosphorylase / adenosine deaminase [Gaiellaceae bacterium]|nr:purine-nucleoside/S-methyl-5-thioadenosine phosphorylase / adenosine deaminase [Gaiellaceae bacterium]
MIRWDRGPYAVAFTTRVGGVSGGAFESLNLGALTDDDPLNVVENRRLACEAVGADATTATMAWQHHSAEVRRAEPRGVVTPGTQFDRCDGLWSDEAGQAMMLVTADCLPIALGRANGSKPALSVIHAGWRGLLAGIVAEGAKTLGGGRLTAAIGPGIGPCCYEVGEEVREPFRAAFGDEVVTDGRLDLWSAAEQALRAAGCDEVERTDLCTYCHPELFFSHRRDRGRTGRQGVVGYIC